MQLFAVLLAAAAVGTAPSSGGEAPPSMSAAHLGWKVAPTGRELARRFPDAAKQQGVDRAAVTVNCVANAFGNLGCEAASESPAGLGFGEAAIGVMSRARVRSTDAGGPEGRRFSYNVKFGAWSPEALAAWKAGRPSEALASK